MLVRNNPRLPVLLVSCMTSLTAIIRFRTAQRLLPTIYFCSALSPIPGNNPASNRLGYFKPVSTPFSSSKTESTMPFSSSSSMLLSANDQTEAHQRAVHLNHAGASPSPQRVMDKVCGHLELEQEDGGYAAQNAVQKSGELNKVYLDIAKLIHATEKDSSSLMVTAPEIALVESATVGWTRAFYALVQRDEQERKERFQIDDNLPSTTTRVILISEAEYAANVVAVCQWAQDHNDHWMVLGIPSSNYGKCSTGMVDLQVFDNILEGTFYYKDKLGADVRLDPSSIAIVCITHIPTNSGIVNPVEEIGERISTYNKRYEQQEAEGSYLDTIKYLVDACQSIGQMDVNVKKIKCDALVATGRKYLRGPRGTGFLYISNEMIAQNLIPSHIDHYGCPISKVPSALSYQLGSQLQDKSMIEFSPREGAKRFEFWESSISSRLGLGEAVCIAMEKGLIKISDDIQRLSSLLRSELEETIPSIRIHHRESTTCGIVTFYCENVDAKTIQATMGKEGFELSMVPATSTPLDSSSTNVPDLVRASVSYTTTENDIMMFCRSLASFLQTLNVC